MSLPLKLLLIDSDPIVRIGLRVVVEQFLQAQVVAEAESGAAALQILAELSGKTVSPNSILAGKPVDLVVLELSLSRSQLSHNQFGLQCRQLKARYPNLPVLLLGELQEPSLLAAARQAGVDGYCPKGTSVPELIAAMRLVAAGRSYWIEESGVRSPESGVRSPESGVRIQNPRLRSIASVAGQPKIQNLSKSPTLLAMLRNHLHLSGLRQINATLTEVTAQLQVLGLPVLDRAILAGQRRELLAARWLVNQLLASPKGISPESKVRSPKLTTSLQPESLDGSPQKKSGLRTIRLSNSSSDSGFDFGLRTSAGSQLSLRMQSVLFDSTLAKLQFSLQNLNRVPLEIDIFREEKKRELLYIILNKVKEILDEIRFSQVKVSQLRQINSIIIRDLWQTTTTEFFGKYATIQIGEHNLEIVKFLLQDVRVVQTAILDKIPLVVELFSYLLFQTPLVIDNVSYPANTPEAMERAELILHNLIIQLANAVVQPLLNQFADVESIKQNFYDKSLISTREIERFRNNLSWRYRWINSVDEPRAIFESRYDLFVLASRGITKISIYAPRSQELAQLSGIQLAVTLALETRDAIAPRLRAAVAFLGSGIVYVLTQVIGRAIGLIGRGVLQGIGGSFPESKFRRSERPK